jgi:hypothetical protein
LINKVYLNGRAAASQAEYGGSIPLTTPIMCRLSFKSNCAARWANIDPDNVDYPKAVPMKNAWSQT